MKANPHPLLITTLRTAGCRAEISSIGELEAVLDAGFLGADCLYTGPGKTDVEITYALAQGVRRFSSESAGEMQRLGRAALAQGTEAVVLLRVNGAAVGSTGLRMTGAATQFGVDEAQVLAAPETFTDVPGTRLAGLHLFPISNARDEGSLVEAIQSNIALAARLRERAGFPMEILDLGGGFAAPYAHPGTRPTYPRLREELEASLDEQLPGWRTGEVEIAFESGRYLVGDCGRLAATVQDIKRSRDQTFVVLDTGINHLGGMTGLGRLARAAATPETMTGPTETGTLVGPLCTPADVLGRGVEIPRLTPGDHVIFPNVGAYGLTASLVAFLGRAAPTEVVLQGPKVLSATRLSLSHESVTVPDQALELM